ncbi:ankyrin repeat, SAM and basic leucine zipper domain-containing protein 1-like [Microcaecilia unicolor]|uniref:Ankyrin repeat, SAM and basic leucine zipper domain-containing protein 1-like n=1 Tax=Microcaecilia unicolor TaxID=1415580 RepID=A0A6P7Z5I2_9AMPH|nr:ankyrin repeat, SAM and basic leucine zipper domain-containing protein 1-like [Microcaecilia unicolor]
MADRSFVLAGGGESSDSEDSWDVGFLSEESFQLKNSLPIEDKEETLKKALTMGNVTLVEELLNAGLNVESRFQFGWTPLMYAASVANLELVRFLLDKGANASFDKGPGARPAEIQQIYMLEQQWLVQQQLRHETWEERQRREFQLQKLKMKMEMACIQSSSPTPAPRPETKVPDFAKGVDDTHSEFKIPASVLAQQS